MRLKLTAAGGNNEPGEFVQSFEVITPCHPVPLHHLTPALRRRVQIRAGPDPRLENVEAERLGVRLLHPPFCGRDVPWCILPLKRQDVPMIDLEPTPAATTPCWQPYRESLWATLART